MNRLMIVMTLALLVPAIEASARAEEREVRKIEWSVDGEKGESCQVNAPADGKSFNVLKLEKPGVKEPRYAIRGEVKYDGVKEPGYLEMWNYFDDGGFFFSRTLGDSGPMGALKGSSDWRPFILPFNAREGMNLDRIEVNIVLPGAGHVMLRSAKLVEYAQKPATTKSTKPAAVKGSSGAWWSDDQGNWFGAIVGTCLGLYGAVIGTLASRGKARRLVISLMIAVSIVGCLLLALGLAALTASQPYAVWYPLLLIGGLSAMSLAMIPSVKRRYDEHEFRRMTALDAAT